MGLWAVLGLVGCGETAAIGGAGAAHPPRTGADDADLWNLAPADAAAIGDVDLATLRASPWTSALMTGELSADREERLGRFGYDVFADADRMVVVAEESTEGSTEGSTAGTAQGTRSLTLARGRFNPERIAAAFVGVTRAGWRDSAVWEQGSRAVALVTPRTVAQGGPDDVRGAIDAGWGIVPDARTGRLGELRRQLQADRGGAAFIAAAITDGVRARAAEMVELPPGLLRVAARLDVGEDLDVEAVALMVDARSATETATLWSSLVRSYARQRVVALLGLTPVLAGVQITAQGSRIQARLHIPAERRAELGEKLLALLQLLAAARR